MLFFFLHMLDPGIMVDSYVSLNLPTSNILTVPEPIYYCTPIIGKDTVHLPFQSKTRALNKYTLLPYKSSV